jgi:GNAT superfamily N-acetyltransferase
VYCFRPFHNADPPHLVQIWGSQTPRRGLSQPLSLQQLEQSVLSKCYFDRNNLIVATQQEIPVGFAHVGFGPGDVPYQLDQSMGTTHMLMVRGDLWHTDLPKKLLEQAEQQLRSQGAKVLYGGGIAPLNGFYLGLYGGSELPGVLISDEPFKSLLLDSGYRERGRVVVMQRDLIRFRPTITHEQRRIAREVQLDIEYAPNLSNWWEAALYSGIETYNYRLVRRRGGEVLSEVSFWDVEPLATSWALRTAGAYRMFTKPEYRRQGYATYLMGEAFRELHKRGTTLVEVQTMRTNEAAIDFYRKLGFAPVDHGLVLRRDAQ